MSHWESRWRQNCPIGGLQDFSLHGRYKLLNNYVLHKTLIYQNLFKENMPRIASCERRRPEDSENRYYMGVGRS